ncbi:hypothetical protein [Hydrogenophaga sp.]|uniref:hypothetical protein n=1 Tax=Hydrogenophaga sp. TaxID=1904254 RepID=UPI003F724C0A
MPSSPPPPLQVEALKFAAKIDYATFTNHGIRISLPRLTGSHEWTPQKKHSRDWQVTVQDPTPSDLRAISVAYENPRLLALEVAVDATPREVLDPVAHADTLKTLYLAIAARFRPEDKALWDYGVRGALSGKGQKPKPLERRHPTPKEQVIYGRRVDLMQAKLYLKTLDQHVILPVVEQPVRMEIALQRWACVEFGLDTVNDLFGYPYRAKFATHFRIIDRPEVRAARELNEAELRRRTTRMQRAWATAGVAKFAVGDHPREDALIPNVAMVRRRARAQLPAEHYKLMRDQHANAKIGNALMGLERRMRVL